MEQKTLLKKRVVEDDYSNGLFADIDTYKQTQRKINSIASELSQIVKTIPQKLLYSELNPVTAQDQLISPREAAKILCVSIRTVALYRERGLIAFIQHTDRKIVYRKSDILSFVNRNFRAPKDYCE